MAGRGSERKVVTALFCDLVGFTSMSEGADPEDVDRILGGYFAMARREIERHGGTVEKFIGDAVVGIFGAPVTHEDDAERAVRAGLGIARAAADLPGAGDRQLELRVGINTGEALVRTDVRPDSGEGMVVGDAINTAARIQSVAPVNGVGVGLTTWELTRLAIEYEEQPPATLKGKAEPVRVFAASSARTALGVDTSRSHAGGYVGREPELNELQAAFEAVVDGKGARFVAIEGEAGIGKSRILAELRSRLGTTPSLVWRQGRCLPYGEGITFWALGEIVKTEAGILEGDDPQTVTSKVEAVLSGRFEGVDRTWLRDRLLLLLGVATTASGREESFGAWRTFLEGLAADRPVVVVLEDVHWAEAGLFEFLASLIEARATSRLLVLATTRPTDTPSTLEGFERIRLEPLTAADTERLIGDLLGAVLPPGVQRTIVERSQGNPLFAEEFVRLLVDRDLIERGDGVLALRPGASVPLPDSITTLLAARLDTLPPQRKALLADAAVIGSVFWAGAVQALAGRSSTEVMKDLDELARIELVRREPTTSMVGEEEFGFWHALARDVAYSQLPRAERASRHVAAARWIEGKAGERVDDVVELLAHHYATAHELAGATGDANAAAELRPLAARYLARAGDHAAALDPAAGAALYRRALERIPDDDPQRPAILTALAEAVDQVAEHTAAAELFEEAIVAFKRHGDPIGAARTTVRLRIVLHILNEERAFHVADEAFKLLTSLEPSPDLVYGLTEFGVDEYAVARNEEALQTFDRALQVAEAIGMSVPPRLLRFRGSVRVMLGDEGGLADYERAIDMAKAAGLASDAAVGSVWYASNLFMLYGHARVLPILEETLAYAQARGIRSASNQAISALTWALFDVGELDRAVEVATRHLPAVVESREWIQVEMYTIVLAAVATLRGDLDELARLVDGLKPGEVTLEELGEWPMYMTLLAAAQAALGRPADALETLDSIASTDRAMGGANYVISLGLAVRVALELDAMELADRLLEGVAANFPAQRYSLRLAEALLAEARGRSDLALPAFEEAAVGYGAFQVRPEEGVAWLGVARTRLAVGGREAAADAVANARAAFEIMRAPPWLARCDALARLLGSVGASS